MKASTSNSFSNITSIIYTKINNFKDSNQNILGLFNFLVTTPLLLLIKFYSYFISPLLGKNCRFYPTCSSYSQQSLKKFGPLALLLIIKRILKCGPWHPGGTDQVPNKINLFTYSYFKRHSKEYKQ